MKREDNQDITFLIDDLFKDYSDGMYFDEFKSLATCKTSELFLAIYDCIYQYIPCVKNFLILKANYKKMIMKEVLLSNKNPYNLIELKPPSTRKMVKRIIVDFNDNKKGSSLFTKENFLQKRKTSESALGNFRNKEISS